MHVTQAIQGPESDITVQVKGTMHKTGFGSVQTLIQLAGDFTTSSPSSMVVTQDHYTAHLVVDDSWNGKGGFEYLGRRVEDVPVKSTAC